MAHNNHKKASRNFDDSVRREFETALMVGDSDRINQLAIGGGRSENCRRECRRIADLVLRKEGGFPVPSIEVSALPALPLAVVIEPLPTNVQQPAA